MMKTKLYLALILTVLMISGTFAWSSGVVGSLVESTEVQFEQTPVEPAFGTLEYNAVTDFTLTQNANSIWQYGYTADPASDAFQPLTNPSTNAACSGSPGTAFQSWTNPNPNDAHMGKNVSGAPFSCGSLRVPTDVVYMHTGQSGQRSVVRWKAPVGGTFQVTGTFEGLNGGYREARILKNGVVIGTLNNLVISGYAQQPFNFTETVAVGDTIDFSLGWGDGSWNSDGTGLSVSIAPPVNACMAPAANLQVNVPAENSPIDVHSVNTNASLVGNAKYVNAGKVGRAFEFDGNGDYVRIEDNAAQKPENQLTAEGWFKFNSLGGLPHLVSKPLQISNFNSYAIWFDSGNIRIGYYQTNGTFTYYDTGFVPPLGAWNHYALVLNTDDTGANANTIKLFVNGVESFSGAAGLPIFYNGINDAYPPHPLLIGADFENNNPQFFLNGQADEVSIYGRALTQAEVFDIVQQGSYGKCAPVNCVEPPNGLVSWFAGEQNSLDSKSNNHGTLQNGATHANGKVGRAFSFDGADDHVSVPNSTSLDVIGDQLTLEAWVNPTTVSGDRQILSMASSTGIPNGRKYGLFIQNGFLGFEVRTANGYYGTMPTTGAITPGVWTHVAGVYNGSQVTWYVNGVSAGSSPLTGNIVSNGGNFTIGQFAVAGASSFQGAIDEVGVYNRELSPTELMSIVTAGSSGKCKPTGLNPPANQTAWFTGDGDAHDLVTQAGTGTLGGDTSYRVGRVSQAFKLDGSGDYISTPDSSAWDFGTNDFAIEAWFNTPSGTGVQRIISAGSQADGANNLWSLGYGDICAWGCGQRINLAVFNGGGYSDFSSAQLLIRPNTWHHVAVVRSGTTFTFYLDGVASGTASVGAGFALNGGSSGAIIGARFNSNPSDIFEFANGMLDEISLYSRAVTASEVAAIYNAGVAGKTKVGITFPIPNDTTQISDATVTFANNISGGTVSQSGTDLGLMPALPPDMTFTGLAYNLTTTAAYQNGNPDDVRVCFNLPSLSSIGAGGLRLLHLENGNWVDRTASANTLSNFCSDNIRSLSPFVIVEGNAPSSYGISGRVTNGGNGISNVLVTLSGDAISTATTNANGDYSFGSLPAGGNLTVTPSLVGYSFDPANRVYDPLTESITNAHFTAAAIPTVSMGDATVTEGDSGSVNANFNVTLSAAYVSDVTVFYSTYDGTATGGLDYTSVGSSVVFAPGETVKVVSVPVLGDTLDEENEDFNIFIGSATNATVLDGSGVGTINDNDVAQCVAAPTGRVASYKGEGNAIDSQGTNHGTANGDVTYAAGKVGQGFKFDGQNDYVEIPDSSSLKPANLTIETWVRFDSMTSTTTGGAPTGYQNLIFKKNSRLPGTGFEGGYSLVKNPDDRIGVGFNSPSTATDFASSTTVMQTGVWYHIAATHDGTNIKLYINGQLEGTGTATFPIDYGTTPLYLGSSQVPFSGYFNGVLDETSIYNRALTESEVQSIYNAGSAGICPTGQCVTTPDNQKAWYRGEGNAVDSQGTSNGAAFNGVTYTAGKVGQTFDLPDGNAHVQVADSPALRPTNFTVEGWFNFSSYNNEFRQLIGKSSADPSYSSYVIYIYGGLITASSTNGVDLGNSLNYSLAPIPGQWYHIAFTREEGGTQTLYVNGVAVDSDTANSIAYANTPLILGHDTGGSIHGKIDEVSIYDRAMSAAEVQSIVAAGGAGKCPQGPCVAAPNDLQSWYRFQNNADDVFGLHTGAAQGGATYVPGRVGQAINMDGVDDSVDLGSWFDYQTFTISMWINVAPFSEQPSYANIIDNNHTGSANWVMQRVANENRYAFGDNGGGEVSFVPTPNTWQHVTVTRVNGSSLKLYLDGALVGEDNSIGTIGYNGAQFLRLGRWGGGGRHLKGKIDELDIYTRALTAGEVASVYGAGATGKCVPPQCVTTPTNQVAQFKGQNNANDSQGTNNGTASGGVTYASGKVGQAFNFADASANVSVPDSPSLRPDSFTIEGWFNFTGYSNEYRTLLNKPSADPSYSSYGVYIYGGLLTAQSTDGVNLGNTLDHGLYPTPGQWYHVAFTRQAGGQMKLYVNGVEVDSEASNPSVGYSNSPLTFGNGTDAANQGKIDELSIYSRALSVAEVQSIFDAGSAGKCATIGCNSANYEFDDNLDSTGVTAPSLSYIGTGQTFTTETVNGTPERVMNYVGGNAVELRPTTGVIPSNQYEITIVTRFNQTYSYNRILDFKDGSDVGVYVTSGMLTFYGAGPSGPPSIGPGVWVELKFTRTAAGIFTAYVNGVQQFSFNDTGGAAIIGPTNALRFFKDDGGENYGGAIARIQLSPGGCGSQAYTVSGRVTDSNGAGLENVWVEMRDANTVYGNVPTDANGDYAWTNAQAGETYTFTPILANTTFSPTSRTYSNIAANITDANFSAVAPCTFTVDPDFLQYTAAAGSGSFNVITQPGCQWTAVPDANSSPWITLTSSGVGTGNGTVSYTIAANTNILRIGQIVINGGVTQHSVGQATGSGTCPTVTPIIYGSVINGALANGDCQLSGRFTDQFSFAGTAGDRVMIRLSSSEFAESIILHNQANTTIYTATTGGAANDARVPNSFGFYILPTTGTYIISASNWGNGGSPTGNYTLTLHSDRTVPGVTAPSGLIGWYAGEGDTRNQQGASDGTFNGTPTYSTDYVGQSFSLNGVDRYVEVPAASEPFNVSSLSVEAWVNTATLNGDPNTPGPTYRNIASKYNGAGGASWSIDMEQDGAITFYVYDGTPSNYRALRANGAAAILAVNEWKHVAATFDGITQEMKLFINGADAGLPISGSMSSINLGQNNVPVRIGAYLAGTVQGFWQGRLDEVSIYNRALSSGEVTSIVDAGRIGKIKQVALVNQTSANLGSSTVTFGAPTSGTVTETPIDGGALPGILPVGRELQLAFDISTNAPFTGNATVCFAVPSVTPVEFAALKVYHLEGGVWVDRTAPDNVYPNLCALTPSFSPFAITKPLVPSASNVTISGRVLLLTGKGIKGAIVRITDSTGGVRQTRTSATGSYNFSNVAAGGTYVLSVVSKQFRFAAPSRVVIAADDVTDVDFLANE